MLLPVYFWCVFAWTNFARDNATTGTLDTSGHIKGHDFSHFYVLGQIGADRASGDLYSFDAQAARMDRLVPQYENRFLPVHPPQVALFFAGLGRLRYLAALALWWIVAAATYALACWVLWKSAPRVQRLGWWTVAVLCAGNPAFHGVMAAGQTSPLALMWFVLGWLALKANRGFLAGLALGALAYKPSLVMVPALIALLAGEVPIVAGVAIAALVQFAAGGLWFGWPALPAFVENSRGVGGQIALLESQPWQMHSLRSFFSLLMPSETITWILYAVSAAGIGLLTLRSWRSAAPLELRYGVLVLATILVNPHVYSYELVVLMCAFFLIAAWMIDAPGVNPRLSLLLGASFYLPAFDSLTRYTHFQLSVPVLVALTVWLAIQAGRTLPKPSF